jgi:hypothetical protein
MPDVKTGGIWLKESGKGLQSPSEAAHDQFLLWLISPAEFRFNHDS